MATPGREKPRKPETAAVNGIPGGRTDNHVLSTVSGRGKEETATVITVDRPWPKPLLAQGLLDTPPLPRATAKGPCAEGESSALEGRLAAFTTGPGGGQGLRSTLQGRCRGCGQAHGARGGPGEAERELR